MANVPNQSAESSPQADDAPGRAASGPAGAAGEATPKTGKIDVPPPEPTPAEAAQGVGVGSILLAVVLIAAAVALAWAWNRRKHSRSRPEKPRAGRISANDRRTLEIVRALADIYGKIGAGGPRA